MKILINFPTRNRPEKALSCLQNIQAMQNTSPDILLKVDNDDPSDYSFFKDFPTCIKVNGISKSKIHAINRGELLTYDWDILVTHSDDMWILQKGFDEQIISDMQTNFPDTDGCLHYPDGHANHLWTYSIVGRKYFERDGYVYHPDYVSLWCDNEAQEVAQRRMRIKFIENQIIEHQHPAWGLTSFDQQYREQGALYHLDKETYLRRLGTNFESN